MIRRALVDEEAWISRERFNRVLAVYQALPGPEAHELCVYFGMVARGRWGAVLAGLGFMLPGFVLMLAASWAYHRYGTDSAVWRSALGGCQAAVVALVARAVYSLSQHALTRPGLWVVAALAALSQLARLDPLLSLFFLGLSYALVQLGDAEPGPPSDAKPAVMWLPVAGPVLVGAGALGTFILGLKVGLLTFGGAYTAIPFVQRDAVERLGWLTQSQFLDGLAISSVLPAPFVIFTTFVGYLASGLSGALAMTVGVFLPAFAFTLIGHDQVERLVSEPRTHAFLDGVTAAVIGIVAVTAISIGRATLTGVMPIAVCVAAFAVLLRSRAPATVALVMLGAAIVGILA
jgi:chromate transporter